MDKQDIQDDFRFDSKWINILKITGINVGLYHFGTHKTQVN